MAKEMNDIVEQGERLGWETSDYNRELRTFLSKKRQVLKNGDVALNKNHRSWTQIK